MNTVHAITLAIVAPMILWLCCKLVFGAYFSAKEEFVDRLTHKQEGSNGKE